MGTHRRRASRVHELFFLAFVIFSVFTPTFLTLDGRASCEPGDVGEGTLLAKRRPLWYELRWTQCHEDDWIHTRSNGTAQGHTYDTLVPIALSSVNDKLWCFGKTSVSDLDATSVVQGSGPRAWNQSSLQNGSSALMFPLSALQANCAYDVTNIVSHIELDHKIMPTFTYFLFSPSSFYINHHAYGVVCSCLHPPYASDIFRMLVRNQDQRICA